MCMLVKYAIPLLLIVVDFGFLAWSLILMSIFLTDSSIFSNYSFVIGIFYLPNCGFKVIYFIYFKK